jgi:hypothetical protein
MPFTDKTGFVSNGLKVFGKRLFCGWHPFGIAAGVELVAKPLLVSARKQCSSRRRAIRTAHIAVGEPHAVGS